MVFIRNKDRDIPPEKFLNKPRTPIYIVLDNLRSAYNVGSIIRTADAIRAQEIITCGITPHPPHLKIEKTAMGSEKSVPIKHFDSLHETANYLKQNNTSIIIMETTSDSLHYKDIDYPEPVAIIMGNEALGVSNEWFEYADYIVELPMRGYKNSLNVSVATGIIAYEILDQFMQRKILK